MADKTTEPAEDLAKRVKRHHEAIKAELVQHVEAIRSGAAVPATIAANLEELHSRMDLPAAE